MIGGNLVKFDSSLPNPVRAFILDYMSKRNMSVETCDDICMDLILTAYYHSTPKTAEADIDKALADNGYITMSLSGNSNLSEGNINNNATNNTFDSIGKVTPRQPQVLRFNQNYNHRPNQEITAPNTEVIYKMIETLKNSNGRKILISVISGRVPKARLKNHYATYIAKELGINNPDIEFISNFVDLMIPGMVNIQLNNISEKDLDKLLLTFADAALECIDRHSATGIMQIDEFESLVESEIIPALGTDVKFIRQLTKVILEFLTIIAKMTFVNTEDIINLLCQLNIIPIPEYALRELINFEFNNKEIDVINKLKNELFSFITEAIKNHIGSATTIEDVGIYLDDMDFTNPIYTREADEEHTRIETEQKRVMDYYNDIVKYNVKNNKFSNVELSKMGEFNITPYAFDKGNIKLQDIITNRQIVTLQNNLSDEYSEDELPRIYDNLCCGINTVEKLFELNKIPNRLNYTVHREVSPTGDLLGEKGRVAFQVYCTDGANANIVTSKVAGGLSDVLISGHIYADGKLPVVKLDGGILASIYTKAVIDSASDDNNSNNASGNNNKRARNNKNGRKRR